jgi:hypothetical protein
MLHSQYKSINLGVEKSPDAPYWQDQIDWGARNLSEAVHFDLEGLEAPARRVKARQ